MKKPDSLGYRALQILAHAALAVFIGRWPPRARKLLVKSARTVNEVQIMPLLGGGVKSMLSGAQ
ncbi:MAG: hypothetical protein JNM52_09930 [Betaproteobacteria bacterium]|nr:hypothetical protein [Betaproteobacteria bacterium]